MSVPLQRIDCLELVLDTPKGKYSTTRTLGNTQTETLKLIGICITGRGVFATRKIEAGTVVDTAPVIVLSQCDFEKHLQHSTLLHYS